MLKIGLTGGIGCGKSLAAGFLREQGVKVISADLIAKEIINSNTLVKSCIIAEFGPHIYTPEGLLDRKKMAAIVFSKNKALKKINALIHPYVIKYQEDALKKIEDSGETDIAAVEAALIFEAQAEHRFDFVVVVSAPLEIVLKRLQKRDGLTLSAINNRIRSQMPLEEKIKRADYVIINDGSIDELRLKVKELVVKIRRKKK